MFDIANLTNLLGKQGITLNIDSNTDIEKLEQVFELQKEYGEQPIAEIAKNIALKLGIGIGIVYAVLWLEKRGILPPLLTSIVEILTLSADFLRGTAQAIRGALPTVAETSKNVTFQYSHPAFGAPVQ